MSDWLKTLLGVEAKDIPEGATTTFEFANLPRGAAGLIMLLSALALIAGIIWIYRREGTARTRVKVGLASLRILVIVVAFILILEPVLAIDQVEHVDKSTILLLDDSLSMVTRDRYVDVVVSSKLENALGMNPSRVSRYKLVNAALTHSELGSLLAKQNEVHVFRFSGTAIPHATLPRLEEGTAPTPIGDIDPEAPDNTKHAAEGTNLSGAIRMAVEQIGSDRIAAIILITDGRATLGPPAEDIALFLKNKDLKLHTVVVGEAETPRNLRAIAVAGPDRVYRNDPVKIEARVSGRGYDAATVTLLRRYTDGSDDWQRIESKTVVIDTPGKPIAIEGLSDRPPRIGTVEYKLVIETMPDEATDRDNEKSFITQVVEEKARVLLIAGGPAYEYYAIKNVLLRDSTITLSCFLQSADSEFPQDGNAKPLESLPATEKELFQYDVILLHDPDGEAFPPDFRKMLRKFASEHGGGLGFVAGNKHTLSLLRGGKGDDNLAAVLPVVLDLTRADTPIIGIGYGGYFTTPWRMVATPAAFTHPMTRFHSDPRRAKDLVWDRLPSLYWFFPVLKAKPGAVVLARHEDPRETVEPYGVRPILAVHRFGRGNVMFLAADETHRWRQTAEPIFDRFWVQTTRFLVEGRHSGAKRRFRIYVDREVVDMGDAVQVTAEVFDEDYDPLEKDAIRVLVINPKGEEEELVLLPLEGKKGHYSGSFAPDETGDYGLKAGEPGFKPKQGPDTPVATFMAIQPDREMGDVRANAALLKDIAARTRGRSFQLHDLKKVGDPKLIPPASENVVTSGRPVPLWDTWTTIILILLLLCAEWILRKRYRMV